MPLQVSASHVSLTTCFPAPWSTHKKSLGAGIFNANTAVVRWGQRQEDVLEALRPVSWNIHSSRNKKIPCFKRGQVKNQLTKVVF